MGGVERKLHVFLLRARDFADLSAGDRRNIIEIAAADRLHECAADEIAVAGLERRRARDVKLWFVHGVSFGFGAAFSVATTGPCWSGKLALAGGYARRGDGSGRGTFSEHSVDATPALIAVNPASPGAPVTAPPRMEEKVTMLGSPKWPRSST